MSNVDRGHLQVSILAELAKSLKKTSLIPLSQPFNSPFRMLLPNIILLRWRCCICCCLMENTTMVGMSYWYAWSYSPPLYLSILSNSFPILPGHVHVIFTCMTTSLLLHRSPLYPVASKYPRRAWPCMALSYMLFRSLPRTHYQC